MDYLQTANRILEAVGHDNIASLSKCMTRLRLVLHDPAQVSDAEIKEIDGVRGVFQRGEEYQIVLGTPVMQVERAMKKLLSSNR